MVVTLARTLHLNVVAEGVETTEQAEILRGWGCTYAQGYLFARPAPVDDLSVEPVEPSQPAEGADDQRSTGSL
jgi:EAL domain-containing protein (putative c-di-GMP-specific phosphodiesterase class I)